MSDDSNVLPFKAVRFEVCEAQMNMPERLQRHQRIAVAWLAAWMAEVLKESHRAPTALDDLVQAVRRVVPEASDDDIADALRFAAVLFRQEADDMDEHNGVEVF